MNLIAKITEKSIKNNIGRIGGNVPIIFLDMLEELKNYKFYISFQNPENEQEYISIFVPNNYEKLLQENIYPCCSIKVFTHFFSQESSNVEYTINSIRKREIVGYQKSEDKDFITKSIEPNLIQDEEYYYKKLEEDGYRFFLQIDEDFYSTDLLCGNYIFGYGAVYLYKHISTGNIIAGFWQ